MNTEYLEEWKKLEAMKTTFLKLKEADELRLLVTDWEAYKKAGKEIPIGKYYRAREDAEKEIKELKEQFSNNYSINKEK